MNLDSSFSDQLLGRFETSAALEQIFQLIEMGHILKVKHYTAFVHLMFFQVKVAKP